MIHLSEKENNLIYSFVKQAMDRGYAHDLNMQDFFHGHFIFKGPKTVYENPDEMLADITLYLFHSEEYTDRWWDQRKKGFPEDKMTPRSFVGWPDGKLQPAIEVVPRDIMLHKYESSGTIYAQDLVHARPELSDQPFYKSRGREDVEIKMPNGEVCTFISQFYFLPSPSGLNIFLRCVIYH